MTTIDINADLGESFGTYKLGNDSALMPYITSCNIACGFHAGDPHIMLATVRLAKKRNVQVGAHPGYPDLQGFGRRRMEMAPEDIETMVLYQIGALAAFCRVEQVELTHVKPHGALYNQAAKDPRLAIAISRAVARFSKSLVLVGLAGSALVEAGKESGLKVAGEGFPERTYEADGSLRSRQYPDSLITDPATAAAQALELAREGVAIRNGDQFQRLAVETLCIHGDSPHAEVTAAAVYRALEEGGVELRAL
jgi:UPF0271 protein